MEIESAREFRSALMTISLKQAEEAVELSEARFQQPTQALPSPVWTASDDGQLTYVNETWLDQGFGPRGRWYEQVGLTPEEEAECGEAWEFAVGSGVAFKAELRRSRKVRGTADPADPSWICFLRPGSSQQQT